jgi:anti-sigma factor RsiW
MSHATASHPTPEALTAYGLGKLADPETEVVARHLTTCADCRRLVESLPADSLVGLVRSTKQATVLPAADPAHAPTGPGLGQSQLSSPAEPPPPPPADLPPELAEHPRYRILRVLGRGGMGVVYEAEHRHMGRKVALKVVSQALVDRPEAVERFNREVHAAAKLIHPNIVTAFDAEQAGSLHLLVMEYVPGQSLAGVVEKRGPLPVVHACHFVRQAALGLQHAFEQGMVHRDLKPHNLMVTPKGQIKILDFGLARLAAEKKVGPGLTAEDAVMGTPEYLAPEQALDARQADVRADIYSLGCTLYCLLAGQPPFPDGTAMQKIMAHLEKQVRPLPEVRPDVPADLWAVVERMLAKDPAARYQKPVEVAQALVPFIKPGAKPAAGGEAPPPGTSAAGAGTVLGGDTSKVLKLRKEAAEKPPVLTAPAPDEPAAPFANLADAATQPMHAKKAHAAAKPSAAAWFGHWRVRTGAATAVLILGLVGLWAGGVLKVKTPQGTIILENVPDAADVTVEGPTVTVARDGKVVKITAVSEGPYRLKVVQDGQEIWSSGAVTVKIGSDPIRISVPPGPEDARVVLEIDQAGAELFVDEQKRTIAVPGDYKPVEVKVKPGRHKLRISKAGFEDFTQTVEFRSGKTESLRVRLKPAEDGFVSLFNGKDPTGWETVPGDKSRWQVKDGILTSGGGSGHLFSTKGDYENFHLRVEARINDRGNSGVFFRSLFRGGFPPGYEAQINATHPDPQKTGSLYGIGKVLEQLHKPGEWFTLEVIAEGTHIVILVNGKKAVDLNDATYRKGHLALQQHDPGTVVAFRKIEIKELPPSKPAEQAFVPLFNGKDLTGWVTDGLEPESWLASGTGELIALGNAGKTRGWLLTARPYTDFQFRCEFQLSPGSTTAFVFRAAPGERSPHLKLTDDDKYTSHRTGSVVWSSRGNVFEPPPYPARLRRTGEWNELVVELYGNDLVMEVNGALVNAIDLKRRFWAAPEVMPRLKQASGRLGFQKHTGEVRFRKIEIKELPPTKPDEQGFVPLFNGKDLTGWKLPPGSEGKWQVLDGILTGTGPKQSHLFSARDDYENFHLRAEARINSLGNSGVCFRTFFFPDGPMGGKGYEAQICGPDYPNPQKTGSLMHFGRAVEVRENRIPPSDWFLLEVVAEDTRLVIKLNGTTTVDWRDPANTYRRGHIALQQLGPETVACFRKIEIKELPPAVSAPPKAPVTLNRVSTSSGLEYQELKVGTGETVKTGDTVVVHYTGWLARGGKKFDSSLDRNKAFEFTLGAGKVIKGWDEGVVGMKVGGKRKLMIPAKLAYGHKGAGRAIPPDADLIFEVELLRVGK